MSTNLRISDSKIHMIEGFYVRLQSKHTRFYGVTEPSGLGG